MAGTCGMHGREKICVQYVVGKPKGTKPFGSVILDWILEKQGGEGVDWMHLAQNRASGGILWTR
jgi:hypothetical protein